MRFLHVADIHLDTSFAGRSETVRRRLREASRDALRHAVDVALREDVDAVLIAGDLFDGDRLSFQTERFLMEQVGRLGDHGITVVYATGNHDPGSATDGPRSLPWPPNVVTAGDATPKRIEIPARGGGIAGYVHAIGHDTAREERDLARLLPRPEGALPEIGLLHTQVHASRGADQHGSYAPSDLAYLRRSGHDYWALGHVHVPQELSSDPPIWYSGSLQGRSHGEPGEHGALLVDLSDRGSPVVSFRQLAPIRWETLKVGDLEAVQSFDALTGHVSTIWREARSSDPGLPATEWMVRVVFEGPCALWAELQREEDVDTLSVELRDVLGVMDIVVQTAGVHPVIPLEEHRARTDVLAEALRLIDEVREGRAELPQVSADDLAGAPGTTPEAVQAYVRALLEGMDGELAARMLEGEGRRP
jgi:DNA repair exonuclease SbcCD nuclease subunit